MFVHLHSSPLVVRQSSSSLGNSVNANCQYGSNNDFQPIEILDVKEERRLLLQCLQECGKQIQWRSEVADVHTFRKVVSHGCRALHFSGHGVPGKVIFESATCEAHFLSQDELKTLLLAGDQSRPENAMRLVFVSACHSESVAEAFVSAGVPHVVVVPKEDKVLDQKAMEFSKAFYTALLAGHSVLKSFEIGQVQADIVTVSDTHQSRFKLLGTGNHATSHLFSDLPPGMYEDLTPPLPINECDAVAEAFIGRSLEVHAVFTALAEGARMVCLVGDAGMGKTEIALQACQYATERHLFERIFFLRWTTSATSLTSYVLARLAKCVGISQPPTNDLDGLCELLRGKLDAIRPDKRLNFLLVLDGCNHLFSKPNERNQLPQFQAILSQLLRRVRSLSLLLTSTNRLGGGTGLDCGVGERIISIEPMPPWDAALLFTVRAPRRLQVHEMGGGLAPFAKSSIMEALGGHARTICAVAQLLENHDLARDEGEFLHYLIPAIIAGLDPASKHHFSNDYCPLLPYTASSKKAPTRPPGASQTHDDLHHLSNLHIESKLPPTPLHPPSLHASISVASQMSSSPLSSSTSGGLSPQQLQLFAIKRRVEGSIASPEGCMIWSHAVVEFNKSTQNSSAFDLRHVREVAAINAVPFEYLGQQVSRFFASQLRQEAVLRPLSTRCMDFLSSSDRIWGGCMGLLCQVHDIIGVGRPGMSPNARGGFVDVQMFRAFWTWFQPLLSCIKTSRLWGFKHPRLLHGFISKSSCQNMLRPCVPGTFLLRFSETKPSCLVVVFVTAAGRVEMVPIEYKHSSPRQFEVYLHDSMSIVSFPTLHELVLNVHVLKYIYPHTPKHDVFQVPHDGAPRSS